MTVGKEVASHALTKQPSPSSVTHTSPCFFSLLALCREKWGTLPDDNTRLLGVHSNRLHFQPSFGQERISPSPLLSSHPVQMLRGPFSFFLSSPLTDINLYRIIRLCNSNSTDCKVKKKKEGTKYDLPAHTYLLIYLQCWSTS